MRPSYPRRALSLTLTVVALCVTGIVCAQQLPVSYQNSTYVVSYNPETRHLECTSNNTNCVWRTQISTSVPSFAHVAAVATAAGPVIVYTEDNGQTLFALPHFRTGSLSVENSGESLRGTIGNGWLLNCVFQPEQYGAKLVCQLLESGANPRMREYKWDINMWGTHRCVGTSDLQPWTGGATPGSARIVNTDLKLQLDVPQGFRYAPMDASTIAMYGPTDGVFMTVFSDAGSTPIEELGEAYMAELGVNVQHRSMETLDNGKPALLLMGTGTINGVPSLHVMLAYSDAARTWVLSYTGRADVGDAYVPAFMQALNSFQPLQ